MMWIPLCCRHRSMRWSSAGQSPARWWVHCHSVSGHTARRWWWRYLLMINDNEAHVINHAGSYHLITMVTILSLFPPPSVPLRFASERRLRVLRGSVVWTRAALHLPHQRPGGAQRHSRFILQSHLTLSFFLLWSGCFIQHWVWPVVWKKSDVAAETRSYQNMTWDCV